MLDWFIARLKERSTWLGLVTLATALGVTLSADAQEAIIAAGIAVAGVVAAVTADPPAAA